MRWLTGRHDQRRLVALVLGVSLALKLLVFFAIYPRDADRIVAPDTQSYERPALALVRSGRFASSPTDLHVPETRRTPGYPGFMALTYAAFGEHRHAIALLQLGLSTLTLWITYLIAFRISGPRPAWAALLILTLDLLTLVYSQLLMTETLFTLLIVCAAWTGLIALHTRSLAWAAGFGASLAAATLVRPIAYYLFPASLVGLALFGYRARLKIRKTAIAVLVVSLPWVILVEGWRLRNYLMTDRAVISEITVDTLLWYRAGAVVAARDGISLWEARARIARELPDTSGWPPARVRALQERRAVQIILSHPVLMSKAILYGAAKILAGTGRADLLHFFVGVPYEERPSGAIALSLEEVRDRLTGSSWVIALIAYVALHLVLVYIGAVRGLLLAIRGGRSWWPAHVLLAGIAIYLVVMAAGPEAYARFRVPVMPLLAIFAGSGWGRATPGPG
jgi:4-amino-4-deoxy-L-arabinose transferase-like glycosyltransferase